MPVTQFARDSVGVFRQMASMLPILAFAKIVANPVVQELQELPLCLSCIQYSE